MPRFLSPLSVVLLLAACSFGSDDDDDDDDKDDDESNSSAASAWVDDFAESYCARIMECYDDTTLESMGFDDEDDCLAYMEASSEGTGGTDTGEDCSFDAAAAEVCLESVEAGDCDEFLAGEWQDDCDDLCG